jgi:hypothetical protein
MYGKRSVWMAERAIVLQVLRDDHDPRWTRAELRREVSDIAPRAVREAFDRLEAEGVIVTDGEYIVASRCVWHLDALELVSV